MLISKQMVVAAVGHYGPFKDDEGTPRAGRTLPYVELLDPDGGGVFRATRAQDAEGEVPPVMQAADVSLELYVKDGGVKCRYHSIAAAKIAPAKAA
jgi:hypothetical protein